MNCEALFNSTKYKLLKIALIMLLSLVLIISTVLTQYQEAHAFVPALVIAGWAVPEAVTIIGALLCAAGLTWAADTAIDSTVNWFVSEAAPAIRDNLYNMVTTVSDGYARVSEDVWNTAKAWVQGNFAVGEQTIDTNYSQVDLDDSVTYPVSIDASNLTSKIYSLTDNTQVVYNGNVYSWTFVDYGSYGMIDVYKNGARIGGTISGMSKMITEGLVFTNELGGVIHPRRFLRNFKGALKAANLPSIRYHDMRHTFVMISLQQGVDIKTIQSDLGHNDISTTLDRYGHVNEQMKQEAANKRSKVLKNILS